MCNHEFTVGLKEKCTLNKFVDDLPIDNEGLCLFHSKKHEWRKEYDIMPYFQTIINNINKKNKSIQQVRSKVSFDFRDVHWFLSQTKAPFVLENMNFSSKVSFSGGVFHLPLLIRDCVFEGGLDIKQCNFNKHFALSKTSVNGFNAMNSTFAGGGYFSYLNSQGHYNNFDNSVFNKRCEISDCVFSGEISFLNCTFSKMEPQFHIVKFYKTHFTNRFLMNSLDFENANFESPVTFESVVFDTQTKFAYTKFPYTNIYDPTILPTVFKNISITQDGKINFLGKDKDNKIFGRDTEISIKNVDELPQSAIVFENADLDFCTEKSRKLLFSLEKLEKVELKANCIKYRQRTELKELDISVDKQNLIQDWSNTFCYYLLRSNRLNLGVEIVEKTDHLIKFFYYTHDKIEKTDFDKILENASQSFFQYVGNLPVVLDPKENPQQYINNIDFRIAAAKICFQIAARAEIGQFSEKDFEDFIDVIPYLKDAIPQINIVQNNITNHYSQKTLLGIGNKNIMNKNNDK